MNLIAAPFSLLAQNQHTLAEASEHFRQTKSRFEIEDVIIGLVLLLVTAIGLLLLKKLLEQSERRKGYHHPGRLFEELIRAHKLNRRERALLRRLAAHERLDDPGRMFLEPERFDVSRIPDSLAKRRAEVFALRDRLFAEDRGGEVSWLAPQVKPNSGDMKSDQEQDELASV
ncbi:MAG: hypothetical protein KDA42_14995 [Planctomycetales bacterium]|nr:hypothetical protein [Planctomycetales bacterium]